MPDIAIQILLFGKQKESFANYHLNQILGECLDWHDGPQNCPKVGISSAEPQLALEETSGGLDGTLLDRGSVTIPTSNDLSMVGVLGNYSTLSHINYETQLEIRLWMFRTWNLQI